MKRNLLVVAVCAVMGCMAGCYTPNDDQHLSIDLPTDDPRGYPAPIFDMERPNLDLELIDIHWRSVK